MKLALRIVLGPLLALAPVGCNGAGDGGPQTDGSENEVTTTPTQTASGTAAVEGQTFSGNGVTFTYPEDWEEFTVTETSASAGNELWNQTVGVDDVNFVSVAGYRIDVAISPDNIEERADPVGEQIGSLFAQAGGDLVSGPEITELDGLPALTFVGTAVNPSGATVESRLVLAFDGSTEYFVNCQHDGTEESDIVAGCDQILSTFDVSG